MHSPSTVRASDFVGPFVFEFHRISGALDEIDLALAGDASPWTRQYFEGRRELNLRQAATLWVGFGAFAAEWLQEDADALLGQYLQDVSVLRWLEDAKRAEPFPESIAGISADLAAEYKRLTAHRN